MFSFGKKQTAGEKLSFKIMGMHCTSCAMTIDSELEETPGVIEASTNFATSTTTVSYDPQLAAPEKIKEVIESLDYKVEKSV